MFLGVIWFCRRAALTKTRGRKCDRGCETLPPLLCPPLPGPDTSMAGWLTTSKVEFPDLKQAFEMLDSLV